MKRIAWVVVLFPFLLSSCGDKDVKRNRISGAVTLEGKPIPFGEVIFTPNAAGPQGVAPIKDGKYDTAEGKGIGSGKIKVRVNGLSGPGGKTLCEYETTLDIPDGSTTRDINVPEKDAHNANPKGKQAPKASEI